MYSCSTSNRNMDDEIFLEVCELLEDERKATMLVAMDVTVRRKWLLKKLQRFHTETSMKKHRRRKRKSAPSSTSACIQRVRRTIKKETQEAVEGKPCVVKTYLGTEEDKDYSSIECIAAALQTVPDMDDEIFLEACELLEDEREAKMFVAMDVTARRKWLLKKLRR
ncbi:hypothetical protein CFP56_012755 [Quercus suber]|uniref:At2g29880-like C-terminal domain-containing protein n=1 Tax=Quercus suber TaxID=58331 RepID=A0AAW0KVR5_QUESU